MKKLKLAALTILTGVTTMNLFFQLLIYIESPGGYNIMKWGLSMIAFILAGRALIVTLERRNL